MGASNSCRASTSRNSARFLERRASVRCVACVCLPVRRTLFLVSTDMLHGWKFTLDSTGCWLLHAPPHVVNQGIRVGRRRSMPSAAKSSMRMLRPSN